MSKKELHDGFVKRPSVQKFHLNIANLKRDIVENSSDSDDYLRRDELIDTLNKQIDELKQTITSCKCQFKTHDNMISLVDNLRQLVQEECLDFDKKHKNVIIGSRPSAFTSSDGIIDTKKKVSRGKIKKSSTPRSNQERKSNRDKIDKIDVIPEHVRNGYDYLSGLDDSEDELKKVNSTQKKQLLISLQNDADRCAAPDPIKMLYGNTSFGRKKGSRRTHSERDLSYVRRRVAMGGNISDEEDDRG